MQNKPQKLVLWCLLDARPGHQNQVLGLAEAIARSTAAELIRVPLNGSLNGLRSLLPQSTRQLESLRRPHFIIGAGHRSHLPLLNLQRRFGGKTVVLMRPSLPATWFDYCLLTDGDREVSQNAVTMRTRGAVNRMQRKVKHGPSRGLILVGGPSKHFTWSDSEVVEKISSIVARDTEHSWTVATSRRTPEETLHQLRNATLNAEIVLPETVSTAWLPDTLPAMTSTWVTQDSVSMTFEALTAGCNVGIIELTSEQATRTTKRSDQLIESGDVTTWSEWKTTGQLKSASNEYREADRCATEILQREAAFLSASRAA